MKRKIHFFSLLLFSIYCNSQQNSFINTYIAHFLTNNATITGHIYKDVNGNGVQNIGEPNLTNVDVLLNQSDGSFQVVTTNANGDWTALVSAGSTVVSIDQNDLPPPNARIQTEGTNPNTVFAVANQTTFAGIDGFFYVGTITGHLYYDTNGNGMQNSPIEPNMQNVTVTVTDFYGNVYNPVSNVLGNWTATVGVGLATVLVDITDPDFPTGAIQTEGTNPTGINVILGDTTFSENEGFFRVGTATGHLYFDSNGNGTQDAGENNMPNVTVTIVDSLGASHTVTTNSSGNWSVVLPAGNATATINTTSAGFPQGAFQTQGVNPTSFVVITGTTTSSGNNGFYNKGILKGHLYKDLNGNGTQNATEPNLPNISIQITESTGAVQTVTTNALGNWQVTVASGSTTSLIDILDPDFPLGAIQTEGINPIISNVLSNQTISTTNCGFFLPLDTDGDGIYDDLEIANGTNPNNSCDPVQAAGYTGYVSTNAIWQASDCDGDGILNGIEFINGTGPYNPCSPLPAATNTAYDASNSIWQAADCDGDGLTNGQEVNLGTNPFLADTDGDGYLDGNENTNGTDPLNPCSPTSASGSTNFVASNPIWQAADCDGDGISNGSEFNNGTDPFNPCSPMPSSTNSSYNPTNATWQAADCDGDGLTNGQEVNLGTNPFLADTDGDGLSDGSENTNGSDPLNPCSPTSASGSTNFVASNPIWQAADCDGDGISNGSEFNNGTDPFNPCSPMPSSTNSSYNPTNATWQAADCDGDGLTNGQEVNLGTNPFLADTDGDGHLDGNENTDGSDPLNPCSPINAPGYTNFDSTNPIWQAADCDGDGVSNGDEFNNGSDPYGPCSPAQLPGYTGYDASNPIWQAADCDGDGAPNGDELANGTDPYNADDNGIIIYNAVSPNNDGKNDTFFIKGIEIFTNTNLSIVNRWGVEVFNATNYANDFKGYSKGRVTIKQDEKLPAGTYFYIFQFTRQDGIQKKLTGYLYIN